MIWDRINAIKNAQGDAHQLAMYLVDISVLHASLSDKIADFEKAYTDKLGEMQDQNPGEPYNRIEMMAKRHEEYHTLRKAQALEKSVIEIIRAAKYLVKIKENEMSASRLS